MKEFWFLIGILLMFGVLAGFSSMSPTSAFAVNLPPSWDFPSTEFTIDESLELDLSDAFFDPDGDPLSFAVSPDTGLSAGVYGDILLVFADQDGELTLMASDGKNVVSKKIVIHKR